MMFSLSFVKGSKSASRFGPGRSISASGFGPGGPNLLGHRCHSGYGPSFADLDPPPPLPNVPLVNNSIWKLFADVLFYHNTTFLSKGKEKQPFRANSAAFIIASRTVYARIKCEQTAAFELLILF